MSSPKRSPPQAPAAAAACVLMIACGGAEGPAKTPSAPRFLDLAITPAVLTESSLVTIAASVTDDDDDLASGRLETESGVSLGFFTGTSGAAFVFVLSWQALNDAQLIEFLDTEERTLHATFLDRAGHRTSMPITVRLECATGAACSGRCVDRGTDPDHCGRCSHACDLSARVCERGVCAPSPSTCVPVSDTTSCTAVCAAEGGRCTENECAALGAGSNIAYYPDTARCEWYGRGRGSSPCDFPLFPELGAWVRCCCVF